MITIDANPATIDDVKDELRRVRDNNGKRAALDVLCHWGGVRHVDDLKPECYDAVVNACALYDHRSDRRPIVTVAIGRLPAAVRHVWKILKREDQTDILWNARYQDQEPYYVADHLDRLIQFRDGGMRPIDCPHKLIKALQATKRDLADDYS
jgi:hypothetical protein